MTTHLDDLTLSSHLDAALPRRQARAVEEHLEACADCRRRLAMLEATARAVAALPEVEPPRALDLSFLTGPSGVSTAGGGPRGAPGTRTPALPGDSGGAGGSELGGGRGDSDAETVEDPGRGAVLRLPTRTPAWAAGLVAAAAAVLVALPLLGGIGGALGRHPVAASPLIQGGAHTTDLRVRDGAASGSALPEGLSYFSWAAMAAPVYGTGQSTQAAGPASRTTSGSSPLAQPAPEAMRVGPSINGHPLGTDESNFSDDALDLSMSASPARATPGTAIDLVGTVRASRQVAADRVSLYAISAYGQRTLIGEAALPNGLSANQGANLHLAWTAGATAGGSSAGFYVLEFDVDLPPRSGMAAHQDTVAVAFPVTDR
jgi:hypothetical protein